MALAAQLGLAVVALDALGEVRIGGAAYDEIRTADELVADVLPPPAYLLETDRVAHHLVLAAESGDDAAVQEATAQLEELRDAFEQRHDHWRQTPLDDETRGLVDQVYAHGTDYLDHLEQLPSLARFDPAAARRLLLDEITQGCVAYNVGRMAACAACVADRLRPATSMLSNPFATRQP